VYEEKVNDSYFQNQESHFRNLGNIDFQSRQRQGLKAPKPLHTSSSQQSVMSTARKQSVFKERLGSFQAKGVVNHPDVDPKKLSKEQGLQIAGHIQEIKQLEKEYDEMKSQKVKIKEK
tara:strand:- start:173 stop:526 length:354 start_codon:yes stop_codon:yes gene_type:complete